MSSIVLIDTSVFLNVLNISGYAQHRHSVLDQFAQHIKQGEGTSLSDHSIIKEWGKLCKRHPMSRVLIWSLDADLTAYDHHP